MAIDPSIALQLRPIQHTDPLESFSKLLALKNMQQQGLMGAESLKGAQLSNQVAQRGINEDQQIKDALAKTGGNFQAALPSIIQASPTKGLEFQKNLMGAQKLKLETTKMQLEHDMKTTEFTGQQLAAVKDQDGYQGALDTLKAAGVDTSRMPPQFDPNTVQGYIQKGMSIKDRLQQEHQKVLEGLRGREVATTEATQARLQTESDARLPGVKAESVLKGLEVVGQKPIQPHEKAMQDIAAKNAENNVSPAELQLRAAKGDAVARAALDRQQQDQIRVARASRPITNIMNPDMKREALEAAAQSLAGGDLTRLKDIASLRGEDRLFLFNRIKQLNPNFNAAEVDRKIKMEDYYANGKGADQIQSFGTFLQHAGGASDAVNGIRNTQSKIINKPLNWWRSNVSGSPEFQALQASLEPVRKEWQTFLLNGHALQQSDRKAGETILSDDSSPAQIQAALKVLGKTAKDRFDETNFRYKKQMGHDLKDPFSPEALEGAGKIGVSLGGKSATAAGGLISVTDPNGNPHQFKSQAEADVFKKLAGIK